MAVAAATEAGGLVAGRQRARLQRTGRGANGKGRKEGNFHRREGGERGEPDGSEAKLRLAR